MPGSLGFAARPGEDGRVSEDAGAAPGEPAGTELSGLPGARMRTAGPGDAASLLRLQRRLDRETSFMLLEDGERDSSAEALAGHLDRVARSGNSVVIVAEIARRNPRSAHRVNASLERCCRRP
jgi:hypothetical protein